MIVEKIQRYLNNKQSFDEALDKELTEHGVELFMDSFKKMVFKNEDKERKGKIFFSSSGSCPRQSAYYFHGFEPEGREIDPRTMINFFMGDVVELAMVLLAKKAGVEITHYGREQSRVTTTFKEQEISGRMDGVIHDDKGRKGILEVKSFNTMNYRLFEKGTVSEEYLAQCNAYMDAENADFCCLVGVCKDLGLFQEKILYKDKNVVMENKLTYASIVSSTPESLPPRPSKYGPDEKGFYKWNCNYCAFWKKCRPNAKQVLVNKAYKLKEGK